MIVDLAAETGGNCELTVPGEMVVRHNVTIVGLLNSPSAMPQHASQMYSRNVQALLRHSSRTATSCWTSTTRSCARPASPTADGSLGEAVPVMSATLIASITIFVLSVFLGIELISRVPTLLHTPLMSGTNAIHGIVLIGGMLILGSADSTLEQTLAFIAVVFGTVNIVGGFLVTDRMLDMFKRKTESEARGSRQA